MRAVTRITLVAAATLALTQGARADRRIFGYTYPYMTLPQGSLEVEHYLDLGVNDWDDPDTDARERDWTQIDWRHQLELEYGVTDHLDFGLYNVFRQKPFGELTYDGVKLRSRYRFAEQGELWMDPAIYLELGFFGDEVKLEEMLILSRVFEQVELSFNAKVEQAYLLRDRGWELELIPTAGVGYHFNNHVALALEYYGKLKIEDGEVAYYVSYLGPALSVTAGSFYWTLAAQPQLGVDDSLAAAQLRSLLGLNF